MVTNQGGMNSGSPGAACGEGKDGEQIKIQGFSVKSARNFQLTDFRGSRE
jgi:hypothetical protein